MNHGWKAMAYKPFGNTKLYFKGLALIFSSKMKNFQREDPLASLDSLWILGKQSVKSGSVQIHYVIRRKKTSHYIVGHIIYKNIESCGASVFQMSNKQTF